MSAARASRVGAVALIVLVALNLRPAIGAVGPVLTEIQEEFGLSGTAAGALTTLPLAFFGFYGLLAPFLRRPPRAETLLVASMALLIVGLLLRLVGAPFPLFAGSLAAGMAISIGNIAMPAIIKRDHPESLTTVTAIYTVAMSGGAALAAGLAVPVENAFDASWRLPLGLLAIPTAVAGLIWLRARSGRRARPVRRRPSGRPGASRRWCGGRACRGASRRSWACSRCWRT
ncbi:MFS transporter [Actinomadura sp. CNU-125]|uniref:MFS transporter n=1 Tax=Actinomadura sp. CNU-125 TaxID=1904961 RepID=UPI000AC4AE88|nr:MFS transporter [Actinomadura sp. CNU-125]